MKQSFYHYTSIDTLEKILNSKSLCFTNLDLVDDLDEVGTSDIKKFGRFCYVSCWTKEEQESIPMWKMYTPDMQGVRIKMNEFPFKKHIIHPGQFSNKEQIETYINATERDEKGLPYILNTYPQMLEVDYTEREELLYPKIKTENKNYKKEIVFENGESKEVITTNTTISYDTKYIGLFKRKCWEFQKEWRYKIILSPYTYKELANCKKSEDQMKLMQRLEDEKYKPSEDRIFLELADDSISKMEILIGPRATDEQINRVISLAIQNGIRAENIKKSELRIRYLGL